MKNEKLISPCSYQGGKQRIAENIVDIIFNNHKIDTNTKFFDICCGSGAITLELINRGIQPDNIIMIDSGCYGAFWQSVANCEFDIDEFKIEIKNLPKDIEWIQSYLQKLSNQPVNKEKYIYHYLLLQAGSFGSKQIWIDSDKWCNNSFRNYWLPTPTSNRRSPVNPMMPMPETLYLRTADIVDELSGRICAINADVFSCLHKFDELETKNAIVYIDPPYKNTTKYGSTFDIYELILAIWNDIPIYVSEGLKMDQCKTAWCISTGRNKGNICGYANKKPNEEWLNLY